ncbi:UDP-glycosyltransferase 76B1-like [Andrographis paniculata]|uniref:UDP-glycosyltransferase 76B1-like n=1 Tax=Andrographis paniculata TaxID=175694 RepID=UPI0021E8E6F1|nr:UDP-glycosyltransferase 76B1-like [Andrographis paniculata]
MADEDERETLILFPLPFQGHMSPMIQLARILHSRGFAISIFHATLNSPRHSNYPQFTFRPLSDGLSPEESAAADPAQIIRLVNASCAEPFRRGLAAEMARKRVKCIITDANWYFTQAVAEAAEVRRVVMRTSSVCSFLAFAALSDLAAKGYLTHTNSNSNSRRMRDDPVEELPPLKVKDIPFMDQLCNNPQDAYQNIAKMMAATKKASAIIFNTSGDLEDPDLAKLRRLYFPVPTFVIGPFHKCFSAASTSFHAHDEASVPWLDGQAPESVLYVSFGSVVEMDVRELEEVARGLACSGQPFLWAIRPGLVRGCDWVEMLPEGFLEETSDRGRIIEWAPQQEVLRHPSIGGFWTHCGWNSTLESICEGVPMICSPFFGDQLVNSRYVSHVWRVGIRLETGFERGEITTEIRRLMVEEEGKEMRQRSSCLKKKIESSLSDGGSSYKGLNSLVDFISPMLDT